MSAPFVALCQARMNNVERCAKEIVARLEKWKLMSGDKMVSLDEVAWLGALLCKAGLAPGVDGKESVTKTQEGNVIEVTAGSGLRSKDSASGGR
jgi:hypothetical protein